MDIILLERIEHLGQVGDVVTVKTGYARNYLLPQNKALRASAANKKYFESKRKDIEANNLKAKGEAEAVAKTMKDLTIVLLRQASDGGQLFGSATSRDIALQLTENGFKLDRNQIILDRPIKDLGVHQVRVRLHGEVSVFVSINVARSEAEAEKQIEVELDDVADVFDSKEVAEAAVEDLNAKPEEVAPKAAKKPKAKKAEAAIVAAEGGEEE